MPHNLDVRPGFHALHANHLEDLRHAVVWISRQTPLPPLERETFLVQSNGIAQWLKLALAEDPQTGEGAGGGLGIAAGMDFLFPSRFIWQAYRAVLPPGEVPEQSPFDKTRLVWRLYRLLPALLDQPVFAPLRRFMDGAETEVRRYQLAGQIADLFDQYQVFRADWLADWERGRDQLQLVRGEIRELGEELRWQPELWRQLVADSGDLSATSRARIHTRFLERGQALTAADRPAHLPRRIVVFGVSSLPRQALEALSVLSRLTQVVLCVHNPCEFYWADIVSDRDLLTASRKRGRSHPELATAATEEELHQHAHPLLAAWGKQGRDYIRLLDEFDDPEQYRDQFQAPGGRIDIFNPHEGPDETGPQLLQQLQNDILQLTSQQEMRDQQRLVDPLQDRSVVFHEAHSPQREVEILHDQLLAAFSSDPTLRPRDIIVMMPDVDTYAPHIQAVFGRFSHEDDRYIPFAISDQGQRHRQPALIAIDHLLALPESRFAASEVISLLEVPAVRSRFGIAEGDLPLVRQWVEGANIRWGLNAEQRAELGLPANLQRNTWQAGLRRMLLGYGTGAGEAWQAIEPYDEIAGLQAALAGNLGRFVNRLEAFRARLPGHHTPDEWLALVHELVDTFLGEPEEDDLLLINRFRRQAEQWRSDCEAGGLRSEGLPLTIVRERLMEGLEEGGLNQRFLAGKVNFATLMPMRAIPFRRVCLLGMNDGDYPRSRPPVDFDLMALDYRPGDRSRREDDRYLFLEALLSARQQLYISWVGRSIRDDSERPASVLVSQLRDHLDAVWSLPLATDTRVSGALTTRHPLQPFSRDYFPDRGGDSAIAGVLATGELFSYDREWLAAHGEVKAQDNDEPLPYIPPEEPLSLAELGQFLKKPVETFFRGRLQVWFGELEALDNDTENFGLSPLDHWRLEKELIEQSVLTAESETDLLEKTGQRLDIMARRGDLGMGVTEPHLREHLSGRLPDLFGRYRQALADWPECLARALDIRHEYQGIVLTDRISGLRQSRSGQLCRLVVSRRSILGSGNGKSRPLKHASLLDDWLVHLVGNALAEPFETLILGKEENRSVRLPPMDAAEALPLLETLLYWWQVNRTRPLPVEANSAYEWLRGLHPVRGEGNLDAAEQKAERAYDQTLGTDNGYLRSAYPDFPALMASGEFEALVQQLYEPLWWQEQAGRNGEKKS
jgi:exodeoxyribonuclease V gamma subunit